MVCQLSAVWNKNNSNKIEWLYSFTASIDTVVFGSHWDEIRLTRIDALWPHDSGRDKLDGVSMSSWQRAGLPGPRRERALWHKISLCFSKWHTILNVWLIYFWNFPYVLSSQLAIATRSVEGRVTGQGEPCGLPVKLKSYWSRALFHSGFILTFILWRRISYYGLCTCQ